ncbi:MAG TPA: YfhO family protein [Candidatus Kapabacteria bacterium]|nr:YfhO family protein [Candidatus Kapabacteria bacterium]
MTNRSTKKTAAPRRQSGVARQAVAERLPYELPVYWAVGIFALVTIIFFWKHISGGAFLWEDFTEFTYPNQVFAARSFASGTLPFWNPFTFNGMPFLADLQIGFFYPGNLLMYLFSGGTLSVWLAQFLVVLHYFIAMVGMWKLARGLGIGSWGAVFAGVAYGLSGMMVVHMIHPNIIIHLAWFPLITYLFYRGVTERSWLHSLLAGLTLGCALLSGHPQSALYMLFFLFLFTIVLVVRSMRSADEAERKGVVMKLVLAALPVAIGIGIFAIQLLPSQELAGLSERSEMTYMKSLEGEVGPGQLLTLVVPKFFGVSNPDPNPTLPFWYRPEAYYFWETAIYFGVVTLILAMVGLASRRLGGVGWFLGAMGLLGLLFALGDNFLVHPLLARLPLFSTFRIPTRLAVYLAFGGALLAGAGLERVVRSGEGSERLSRIVLIVGGIVAGIGLLTLTGVLGAMLNAPNELLGAVRSTGLVALLVGGGAAAVAFLSLRGRVPATAAAALLLVLGIVDLCAFGMGQNNAPENPQEIYCQSDEQLAAYKAVPPGKLFRVKMREGRAMLMQRNQGPYSGIMLFEGYNPLLLSRRVPPAPTMKDTLDLLDVAYEVKVDSASGGAELAERPSRYPHARMMYDVKVAPAGRAIEMMKGGQVDFARTVVLEEEPGIAVSGGSGQAAITTYTAAEIAVDVTTDKPGILLLSEIWYPSWTVTVDGAPAKLLHADYSLRGVAVPAGKHTVVLTFQSSAFATGRLITIVSLLAALVGIIFFWLKRRRDRARAAVAPSADSSAA